MQPRRGVQRVLHRRPRRRCAARGQACRRGRRRRRPRRAPGGSSPGRRRAPRARAPRTSRGRAARRRRRRRPRARAARRPAPAPGRSPGRLPRLIEGHRLDALREDRRELPERQLPRAPSATQPPSAESSTRVPNTRSKPRRGAVIAIEMPTWRAHEEALRAQGARGGLGLGGRHEHEGDRPGPRSRSRAAPPSSMIIRSSASMSSSLRPPAVNGPGPARSGRTAAAARTAAHGSGQERLERLQRQRRRQRQLRQRRRDRPDRDRRRERLQRQLRQRRRDRLQRDRGRERCSGRSAAQAAHLRQQHRLVRVDEAVAGREVHAGAGRVAEVGVVGAGGHVAGGRHQDAAHLRRGQVGACLLDQRADAGDLRAAAEVPLNAAQPSLLAVSSPVAGGCRPRCRCRSRSPPAAAA